MSVREEAGAPTITSLLDHQKTMKKCELKIGWDLNSQLHGQQTASINTRPERKR